MTLSDENPAYVFYNNMYVHLFNTTSPDDHSVLKITGLDDTLNCEFVSFLISFLFAYISSTYLILKGFSWQGKFYQNQKGGNVKNISNIYC